MFLHRFVRELRRGQQTHAFQREISQVGLSILEKLAELIACPHEQARFAVHVNDKIDGFEEHGIACVRMLDFLRFQRLLSFVQNGVETFVETTANRRIV